MEISEIANKDQINNNIELLTKKVSNKISDTEIDLYNYFQGIKEIEDGKEIICPYCEKKCKPIEAGIDPQKTVEDWDREERTEPESMTLEQLRYYCNNDLKVEIVNLILNIRQFPRPIEQEINSLTPSIKALEEISQILVDINPAIQHATSKDQIINIMKESLEDIRKKILQSLPHE